MTQWNSADKSANVTLSAGNLIATMTSSSFGGVRADNSIASGKYYFEARPLTQPANNFSIGWANVTAAFTAFHGVDKNGVGYEPQSGSPGQTVFNSTNIGTAERSNQYDTICIAFDATGLLFWTRINNSRWNNSLTADPATGVGGFSVATMNAGPYFPFFNANVNGGQIAANFGAGGFAFSVPSGFSALDSNTQAYLGASKALGYSASAPPQDAVDASKLLGYSASAPPQTAVDVSKIVAYVILETITSSWIPSAIEY